MTGPYLAANGARVVTLSLLVPWYGAPVADVSLADATALSGSVALTVANASFQMAVACNPAGVPLVRTFAGQTFARLVGGVGGWRVPVTLPPLANPTGVLLSTALFDAAMAAVNPVNGKAETVSLAPGLDGPIGAFWAPQTGAPAGRLLATLAGPLWWIGSDGVTQVAATRTGPAIAPTAAQVEMLDGGKGWARVATEDVKSWTTPGAIYTSALVPAGLTVNAARAHADDSGDLRVEVLAA